MKKSCLLLMIILLALLTTINAQAPNSPNKSNYLDRTKSALRNEIQKLLRETGIPSISFAIVEKDKIVWAEAFGQGNMRAQSRATSETLYNTGSTFKTITAIALLQQLERKKISLDGSIASHLGDIKIKDLSDGNPVSFRQLLSHTSGLMGPSGMTPLWKRGSVSSLADIVSRITVKREAGKEFEYCNACYALAGYLVERLSGQAFPAYVAEHIFKPLGILTPEPFEPTAEMAEKTAFPYSLWNNRPEPEEQIRFDAYPAGDVYLTPENMARVVGALLNEGVFNGQRILGAETVREMRRKQLPATDYGLGIELTEKAEDDVIMHTGSLPGFSVIYRGDVESRVGIYLVANAGAMQSALDALSVLTLKLMRGEQKAEPLPSFAKTETYTVVPVAKEVLQRYAGTYRLTPTLFVTILEERGRLSMRSDEGISFRLVPVSEKAFVVKELSARLTFNLNAEGKVESLTWNRANRDTVAPKTK
jgi:serine-type D-Ala-D-Ala carboxypeptidase/endopeptidase